MRLARVRRSKFENFVSISRAQLVHPREALPTPLIDAAAPWRQPLWRLRLLHCSAALCTSLGCASQSCALAALRTRAQLAEQNKSAAAQPFAQPDLDKMMTVGKSFLVKILAGELCKKHGNATLLAD